MVRSMGGVRTRQERLGAGIFGLLIAIFLLRAFVDTPGLSLVFLAVFPIVMAAFVLGRTAAIVAAALATVLSVVVAIINPSTHVSAARRLSSSVRSRSDSAREKRSVVSRSSSQETSSASPT